MVAIVTISESNGAGEVITPSILNCNIGCVDQANMTALDNPIVAGTNSFEKWIRLRVGPGDAGGSSQIINCYAWVSAAMSADCLMYTNATISVHAATPYQQPSATDRKTMYYPNQMVTSITPSPNMTIGGSLVAPLDITGGPAVAKFTDYLVMQVQVALAATIGTTFNLNFQYDEVA